MHWDVKNVTPLPQHKIAVELNDGRKGIVDMQPHLNRPGLQALHNTDYFNQVSVSFGALTWPGGEDIAPDTLLAELVETAVSQ